MPKLIEFRDKPLPKTLIGKLSRKDLVAEEVAKMKAGGEATH
jgi:long-chain acyl-CoA synthetase